MEFLYYFLNFLKINKNLYKNDLFFLNNCEKQKECINYINYIINELFKNQHYDYFFFQNLLVLIKFLKT